MSGILKPRKPDFSQAVLKVERANGHIANFDAEAGRFFSKYPYNLSQEADFETERYGYHLYERRPFPQRPFALIVGDAVHNLRSALDYLISACALANGQTINDTHFPIVRLKRELERRLKKDVRKAGPLAMSLVRSIKPYARGNRDLRAIHDLDLADKHRLIVTVACQMRVTVKTGGWNDLPIIAVSGTLDTARKKSQFIPSPPGYEFATPMEMGFSGEIVFGRQSPKAGAPCIATLHQLSATVADVIRKFESAFGCIGLSKSLPRHDSPPVSSSM